MKIAVNHKILDLAGDYYCTRIIGKVKMLLGGHELTNKFSQLNNAIKFNNC